jgi:hypothetical protein
VHAIMGVPSHRTKAFSGRIFPRSIGKNLKNF